MNEKGREREILIVIFVFIFFNAKMVIERHTGEETLGGTKERIFIFLAF